MRSECTTHRAKLRWLSPGLLCIGPAMLRKVRRHRGTSRHRPSIDSRQPILPVRRHQERVGVHSRRPRDSRRLGHVGSSRRRRRFCDQQLHGQALSRRLRRRRIQGCQAKKSTDHLTWLHCSCVTIRARRIAPRVFLGACRCLICHGDPQNRHGPNICGLQRGYG